MVEDVDMRPDQERLNAELMSAGFAEGEIGKAFDWLADLSVMCERSIELESEFAPETATLSGGTNGYHRHLSRTEMSRLGVEGYGLLLMLESAGVIDADMRELVIDRVMALECDDIEPDHIRWVAMMVLSSSLQDDERQAMWVEELVMESLTAH